ncbi:MAG: hypothetical protein LBC75_01485 [Fibromonadaceae bacterium]|jgi:hypothetical protein|nr:hypothetical protein [Fibromonadaceae bacterium]
MAMAIHPVPVLEGQAAIDFAKKVEYNEKYATGKYYSKENHEKMKAILEKAEW